MDVISCMHRWPIWLFFRRRLYCLIMDTGKTKTKEWCRIYHQLAIFSCKCLIFTSGNMLLILHSLSRLYEMQMSVNKIFQYKQYIWSTVCVVSPAVSSSDVVLLFLLKLSEQDNPTITPTSHRWDEKVVGVWTSLFCSFHKQVKHFFHICIVHLIAQPSLPSWKDWPNRGGWGQGMLIFDQCFMINNLMFYIHN